MSWSKRNSLRKSRKLNSGDTTTIQKGESKVSASQEMSFRKITVLAILMRESKSTLKYHIGRASSLGSQESGQITILDWLASKRQCSSRTIVLAKTTMTGMTGTTKTTERSSTKNSSNYSKNSLSFNSFCKVVLSPFQLASWLSLHSLLGLSD